MKKKKKLPLKNKKFLGLSLFLSLAILLLLPPLGYYSQTQLIKRSARVIGSHFVIPPPSPIAKNPLNIPAPLISAKSAVILDVSSGMFIYQKNSHVTLPQASTTKIMTALIALEYYLPDQVINIVDNYREGQNIKLNKGEKWPARSLLSALLISSANDAAENLAANYESGRIGFIQRMNQKAQDYHLLETHFVNPTGIDEIGQYSSAGDLARLASIAIKNPFFSQTVSTPETIIYNEDRQLSRQLINVNVLLGKNKLIKGIKTGWTTLAGECLVGLAEKDGRQIITVILGSENRFTETEQLVDWVFNNFIWQIPV